jgi:hypothetical protein
VGPEASVETPGPTPLLRPHDLPNAPHRSQILPRRMSRIFRNGDLELSSDLDELKGGGRDGDGRARGEAGEEGG